MKMTEVKVDRDDLPVVTVELSFAELGVLFAAVEVGEFDFDMYDIQRKERSRDESSIFGFYLAALSKEKFDKIVRQMINSFGNYIDLLDQERNPRDKEGPEA